MMLSISLLNFHFAQPSFLVFLIALPLLWWAERRFRFERLYRLPLPEAAALPKQATWRTLLYGLRPYLRLIAVGLLMIALARPQTLLAPEERKGEGIDIVLAMDVSSSMLARDFQPNRLEAAKEVAADFISKRPNDRIGLVAFGGEAITQCPLTTDHRLLLNLLGQLQSGVLADGTAIGMGLATSVNRLKESESTAKVVILLTDGVNNGGYIQPSTAATLAQTYKVRVYTIGTGSMGEAQAPIARRDDGSLVFGFVRVEIDEALLTSIAEGTGGKYFRATDRKSLFKVYEEIDRMEKYRFEIDTYKNYREQFPLFVWLALAVLGLELLLRLFANRLLINA